MTQQARRRTAGWAAGLAAAAIGWATCGSAAADIRDANAWPDGVPAAAVEERVAPAPPALVRYLLDDNRAHGIREVPRAATPDDTMAADIREALTTMPAAVHALVAHKLIGVFTVRGLGSTAWAEHVKDASGAWRRGIVVLDIEAVDKRGNTWISWRESTPFRPEPGFAVRGRIAGDGADARHDAIRYILLHEFAHIASIGSDLLPAWTIESVPHERTCDFVFVCLSWTRYGDDASVSRYDSGFAQRAQITYYRTTDKRMAAALAQPLYEWLRTTDFVSPYAATSPHEDFAEAFANFVHVRLMGRPYRVEILRDGKAIAAAGPCWEEPRCAAKRRFLAELLGAGG